MSLKNLKTTPVYDAYWNFAVKRQEVFFNRIKHIAPPWTDDDIIQKYKFTNVYRAADRVSQYLIKEVIYSKGKFTPEDQLFRILIFKLFNNINTWNYMEQSLGEIRFSDYSYKKYNQLLLQKIDENQRIYSAAYIMPSGKTCFGYDKKHQNNLKLLELIMKSKLTQKIAKIKSLKELYNLLLEYPTLGPFLAFQFSIDINYSEICDFDEMSFVVAGPGAKNGIQKCFESIERFSYEDVIKYVADCQEEEFAKRGLVFKSLFGRKMQLIDCQNLFCETDKYARVAFPDICGLNDRKRIKQQYINRNLGKIDYFFPPKWGLDNSIIVSK